MGFVRRVGKLIRGSSKETSESQAETVEQVDEPEVQKEVVVVSVPSEETPSDEKVDTYSAKEVEAAARVKSATEIFLLQKGILDESVGLTDRTHNILRRYGLEGSEVEEGLRPVSSTRFPSGNNIPGDLLTRKQIADRYQERYPDTFMTSLLKLLAANNDLVGTIQLNLSLLARQGYLETLAERRGAMSLQESIRLARLQTTSINSDMKKKEEEAELEDTIEGNERKTKSESSTKRGLKTAAILGASLPLIGGLMSLLGENSEGDSPAQTEKAVPQTTEKLQAGVGVLKDLQNSEDKSFEHPTLGNVLIPSQFNDAFQGAPTPLIGSGVAGGNSLTPEMEVKQERPKIEAPKYAKYAKGGKTPEKVPTFAVPSFSNMWRSAAQPQSFQYGQGPLMSYQTPESYEVEVSDEDMKEPSLMEEKLKEIISRQQQALNSLGKRMVTETVNPETGMTETVLSEERQKVFSQTDYSLRQLLWEAYLLLKELRAQRDMPVNIPFKLDTSAKVNPLAERIRDIVSETSETMRTLEEKAPSITASQREKAKFAVGYFIRELGLEPHQAAGLVGNLLRESGLKEGVSNKEGSGAVGIAQWLTKERQKLYVDYLKKPLGTATFEEELSLVAHELKTTHRRGLEKLKAAKTYKEAADAGLGYYEFTSGVDSAMRALDNNGYSCSGYKARTKGQSFARVALQEYLHTPQVEPVIETVTPGQFHSLPLVTVPNAQDIPGESYVRTPFLPQEAPTTNIEVDGNTTIDARRIEITINQNYRKG